MINRKIFRRILFLSILLVSFLHSLDIPVIVTEPNLKARTLEGVSCGIPLKKGAISSVNHLSFFEGTTEIPAQFDVLTVHEDGTPMWVLASFLASANKNEKKDFKASTQAATVIMQNGISVVRRGSSLIIDNGSIRFIVDTLNFTGIDSLYYGGQPYIGGKTGGIFVDNLKDSTLYANGTVTSAKLVYGGPVRLTLKIDGVFFKKSIGGLGYSYVITTYARSNKVTIDATIRNSINETNGDIARIVSASVKFPVIMNQPSEVSYKFNTGKYAQSEIKDFSVSGKNMTIQEDWNGGIYGYQELASGSDFMFHNIFAANGFVGADIIVKKPADVPTPSKCRGYEDGNWYWLPDGLCKSSRIFISFGNASKTVSELTDEFMLNKSALDGRADPGYVAETELFGAHGKFGTIADEKSLWQRFGKTITGVAAPFLARDFQFSKSVCLGSLHYDIEDDPGDQWIMQWLRTGSRGFLDRAEGWMKYYKTNMTFHTTGFTYDGHRHNVQKIRNTSTRLVTYAADDPKYAKDYYNSVVDFHSWGSCHMLGWGLVSWYCLTGDVEAKEAVEDLAEIAWLPCWYYGSLIPGSPQTPPVGVINKPFYTGRGHVPVSRAVTRPYLFLTNFYSRMKQGDAVWKSRFEYSSEMWLNCWNVDPRGFYFTFSGIKSMSGDTSIYFSPNIDNGWPSRMAGAIKDSQISFSYAYLPGNKYEGNAYTNKAVYACKPQNGGDTLKWLPKFAETSWSAGLFCYSPLAEYFRLQRNEDARDMIIGCASAIAKTPLIISRCGFSHNEVLVDYPFLSKSAGSAGTSATTGNPVGFENFNEEHDKCASWGIAENSCGIHDGAYVLQLVDIMSLAHSYTGDMDYLRQGMESWNKGLKRAFKSSSYSSPENQMVYGFVTGENNGSNRFVGGLKMFYQATKFTDTVMPASVNDLDVAPAIDRAGDVYAMFTLPASGSGSITEYRLKYDTVPIVDYEDFDYAKDYILPASGIRRAPFWYSKNVSDEPAPSGATGSYVMFPINGRMMNGIGGDTLYFALCTRNSNGNLSKISNNAKIWAGKEGVAAELSLITDRVNNVTVSPNPFNPSTAIKYRLISERNIFVGVYDARGKLVADLTNLIKAGKAGEQITGIINWNGRSSTNQALSSGLYIVRVETGKSVMLSKMLMVK